MIRPFITGIQSNSVTERGPDVYSGLQERPNQWRCLECTVPHQDGLCPELHRRLDDTRSSSQGKDILEYAANDRRPCSPERQPQ